VSEAHAELVQRAARWLRGTRRCGLVLVECQAYCCQEIPDAIGWDGRGRSTLVECKVSVGDFYADRRKPGAKARVGHFRYYMTPPGLLDPKRLPPGWGLLEAGKRVRHRVKATPSEAVNQHAEIGLLVAELSRVLGGFRDCRSRVGVYTEGDQELLDSLTHYRHWLRLGQQNGASDDT
jgi:hypothetical protein